jgi:hypothetical protein
VTQSTDGWKILNTYTVSDHNQLPFTAVRMMMSDAVSGSWENYHMAGECMYTENLCSVIL